MTLAVEYIVVAAFDIDRGSVIQMQHPKEIHTQSPLSELMLPEGSHARECDETVFFIRDLATEIQDEEDAEEDAEEDNEKEAAPFAPRLETEMRKFGSIAQCFEYDHLQQSWEPIDAAQSGTNQQHVIRLRTEHGSTEHYHVFISVVDPEEAEVLKLPVSEQTVYRVSDKDHFISIKTPQCNLLGLVFPSQSFLLDFEQALQRILDALRGRFTSPRDLEQEDLDDAEIEARYKRLVQDESMLLCINEVRTKLDSSVRRGASLKSIAFCSTNRIVAFFRPIAKSLLEQYFQCSPSEQHNLIQHAFNRINDFQYTSPATLFAERKLFRAIQQRYVTSGKTKGTKNTTVNRCIIIGSDTLDLAIPDMIEDDEVAFARPIELVKRFQADVMTIYNAILCGENVLFLGHGKPAADVSSCVLAACLLVSPPLRGILKRAFPYACLSDTSFLHVHGYIAGVTNPLFEQKATSWDILCDLENGTVTRSPNYNTRLDTIRADDLPATIDSLFFDNVSSGISMGNDDEWVRMQFKDYTQRIIDIDFGVEEFGSDAERVAHTKNNAYRIAQLNKSQLFKDFIIFERYRRLVSPLSLHYLEIRRSLRQLQVSKLSTQECKRIFQDLKGYINTREEKLELLSLLPFSCGGLSYIGMGLFCDSLSVRECAFNVLCKLDSIPEGSKAINALNYFTLLAFHRRKEAGHVVSHEELQKPFPKTD